LETNMNLLIALLCMTSIGIIDVNESHLNDMVEIVDGAEVIGILVKDHEGIAIAMMGLIILEVDVIAMPIQVWRYDSGIVRMVAVANHRGIRVDRSGQ